MINTIEKFTFTGRKLLLNTRCKSTKENKKPSVFIIKNKGKPPLLLFFDSQTGTLVAFPLLSHHCYLRPLGSCKTEYI